MAIQMYTIIVPINCDIQC